MIFRRLHRYTAIFLAVFLALHLSNHLAAVAGQEAHGTVQSLLRQFYRHPFVEPVLIALFMVQIGLGVSLVIKKRRMTLQTASGFYLAAFILIHLGAVFAARWQGTDTDFAFAAAGMHAAQPWPIVFGLYYGLAVISIGAHLSVALSRRFPIAAQVAAFSGLGVAVMIVVLLSGSLTTIMVPEELTAQFPVLGH